MVARKKKETGRVVKGNGEREGRRGERKGLGIRHDYCLYLGPNPNILFG